MVRRGQTAKLKPGDKVGRYRLVNMLGEGAMGRVWRADGPSGLVAVKLLTKRDDTVRSRFDLEAQALLKLRHPYVVRAVDYGHAPNGTPFIAMEYLDGESVEDRLMREGQMPVEEAVAMAHDAAQGLAAAHQIGLVHRDVKPGNLFLCSDGSTKVLDFGIALWEPSEGSKPLGASRLTKPGAVIGTPSYMAPEQARGERTEDVRTDVWGLAAVLYDVIAGRPPFDANGNNLAEIVRILTDSPDPLPKSVPDAVSEVVMCGLQRKPEDRFQSMGDFAEALARTAGDRRSLEIVDELSTTGFSGALADEVRMVSAVLVESLKRVSADKFAAIARRHGGVGSLLRGGYAVAVFGAESRTGDEALRATRFALELRGLRPKRIGIGTGKAVRRVDKRGLVTGHAIAAAQQAITSVIASKNITLKATFSLQDDLRAPVGACPETQQRIQERFTIVGGRVLDEEVAPESRRPRRVGDEVVPFLGRDTELADVRAVFDEVVERGEAAAVLVAGPPGIGKSRLRYELLDSLSTDQIPCMQLSARGELTRGEGSLGIMREILRRRAAIVDASDHQQCVAAVRRMVPDGAPEGTEAFIGELLGYPFPQSPHLEAARADARLMADRMRTACADLFRLWCDAEPVLVAVEDGQWADTASLEWLEWLVDELQDQPLFVLVLVRPAFFVGEHTFMLAPIVELGELPDTCIATIVTQVLGREEPAVVARAAGNPYFAEELALAVQQGADPDALPATVEGAVQARLDKLAPDEKDLLKRASVLGQRFWQQGLEALGEPRAREVLVSLKRLGIVAPQAESRLAGCQEWMFTQAIVQEVCHGMLTAEQRQALHRSAAMWLSQRTDVSAHEVALHFEIAGEPTHAGLWWIRAISSSHSRGDSHNVVHYVGQFRAVSRPSLPVSDTFDVQLTLIESLHWLGDRERLQVELDLARTVSDRHGAEIGHGARANMWRWHARHMEQSGHLGAALVAAKEAVRLADAAGVGVLRARCRGTLATLHGIRGDLDAASLLADEAMDIVKRDGGPVHRAHAARARGFACAQSGEHFSALMFFRMSRDICVELGAVHEGALNAIAMGRSLCYLGDYASATMLLMRAERIGESLRLDTLVAWSRHHLGIARFGFGETDEAVEDETAAIAHAEQCDDLLLRVAALTARSRMRAARAHFRPALDDAEVAAGLTGDGPIAIAAQLYTARATALIGLNRPSDALAACDRAFDARAATGMADGQGELFLAHHDALVSLNRREEAGATLLAARRYIEAALVQIQDDSLYRAFTQNVHSHRRILALLDGDRVTG